MLFSRLNTHCPNSKGTICISTALKFKSIIKHFYKRTYTYRQMLRLRPTHTILAVIISSDHYYYDVELAEIFFESKALVYPRSGFLIPYCQCDNLKCRFSSLFLTLQYLQNSAEHYIFISFVKCTPAPSPIVCSHF